MVNALVQTAGQSYIKITWIYPEKIVGEATFQIYIHNKVIVVEPICFGPCGGVFADSAGNSAWTVTTTPGVFLGQIQEAAVPGDFMPDSGTPYFGVLNRHS